MNRSLEKRTIGRVARDYQSSKIERYYLSFSYELQLKEHSCMYMRHLGILRESSGGRDSMKTSDRVGEVKDMKRHDEDNTSCTCGE